MAGAADSSDQVSVPQQPCEVQTCQNHLAKKWRKKNEAISLRIKYFN